MFHLPKSQQPGYQPKKQNIRIKTPTNTLFHFVSLNFYKPLI